MGICNCVETVVSFNIPLLLLGGGGYSGADAQRTFACVVATVLGKKDIIYEQIPEHDYYQDYGPDYLIKTKPVQHRPNKNSEESLEEVAKIAIDLLNRQCQSKKKKKKKNAN
jgi:hypothetical protein